MPPIDKPGAPTITWSSRVARLHTSGLKVHSPSWSNQDNKNPTNPQRPKNQKANETSTNWYYNTKRQKQGTRWQNNVLYIPSKTVFSRVMLHVVCMLYNLTYVDFFFIVVFSNTSVFLYFGLEGFLGACYRPHSYPPCCYARSMTTNRRANLAWFASLTHETPWSCRVSTSACARSALAIFK